MSPSKKPKKPKRPKKTVPGLGPRVVQTYEAVGLNRMAASQQLPCSYSSLNDWESETVVPDVTSLIALANLGQVHVEWLLTGRGPRFLDESRNQELSAEERARRAACRAAVEGYLASELAERISPKTASLLREFDFSMLGISEPEVKDVHRVRDLIDMNIQLSHLATHG